MEQELLSIPIPHNDDERVAVLESLEVSSMFPALDELVPVTHAGRMKRLPCISLLFLSTVVSSESSIRCNRVYRLTRKYIADS